MKNKMLVLEHGNKMFYSKEIIQLKVPKEISLLFYTIVAMVLLVLTLCIGCRVNDVIRVRGRIRTQTNNSTVKNVLPGKIERIFYTPEQFVEKDELLFTIDGERYKTLETELQGRRKNCLEQLECMDMLLEGIETGRKQAHVGNILADSKLNEYFENLDYFRKQIGILEYKVLKERNQPVSFYNKQNADEAEMNYSLCMAELNKYKAAFLADVVQKKNSYELELEGIEQELIRTLEQAEFLEVRAPVSGFVQEVSLLNKGDYLSADQVVLVIVPDDSKNFRVEMSVPTKDIGEIVPGMTVKYRLSAFPFYEYKGAEGKILAVESDVRDGNNGSVYYRVYSDIDRTLFTSRHGDSYLLKAGIEVDARIIKERISVMHFICRKLDFMQ